jgi:hypothetical protein
MAFLSVVIYALSCVASAFALTLVVDGTLPRNPAFGPETLGFNGIMIGLAMMPEHFFLVPHIAESQKTDGNPHLIPFRYGVSPANAVFLSAAVIGIGQSIVVFFLWRTATTATQFDIANTICGIVTFAFVVVDGVLLASICGNAIALQSDSDGKSVQTRKEGRTTPSMNRRSPWRDCWWKPHWAIPVMATVRRLMWLLCLGFLAISAILDHHSLAR